MILKAPERKGYINLLGKKTAANPSSVRIVVTIIDFLSIFEIELLLFEQFELNCRICLFEERLWPKVTYANN